MSDWTPYGRQNQDRGLGGGTPYGPRKQPTRGLTPAELETQVFLNQETEADEKKFSLMQPIEWLFDALSTFQYASANLGEDLTRAVRGEDVNILQGLWEGLTWQRKGDWKTTLFGGEDEGGEMFEGMFTDDVTPEWMDAQADLPVVGKIGTKDVIGFIANILLDPSTYVTFGATKAGKKAAQKYSEVAVEAAKKASHNIDNIAKFAKKSFDPEHFKKLLKKKSSKAADLYLAKHSNRADLSRFYNNVMKKAKKDALRMTAQEAQEKLITNVMKNKDKFIEQASKRFSKTKHKKAIRFLEENFEDIQKAPGLKGLLDYDDSLKLLKDPATTPEQAQAIYQRLLGSVGEGLPGTARKGGFGKMLNTVQDYADEVKKMYSNEFMQQFKGMGERAVLHSFGMEGLKFQGRHTPISRGFEKLTGMLAKSKPGELFSKAAYSVLETKGPVAWLKKALGVRNPYQKYLRAKELNNKHLHSFLQNQALDSVEDTFAGVDEKTMNSVRDIMMGYEGKDLGNMTPDILQKFGVEADKVDEVNNLFAKVREMNEKMAKVEKGLAEEKLLPEYATIKNYLPTVTRKRTNVGGKRLGQQQTKWFTRNKKFTLEQRAAMEHAKIKAVTGLDDATVTQLIREKNWGTLNMDLREMMAERSVAHAQAVATADMIKQFRELGINFGKHPVQMDDAFKAIKGGDTEFSKPLMAAFKSDPGMIENLGLRTVNMEGLKGYYFDKDVAEVIGRTVALASSDQAIKQASSFLTKHSALWRGYATLSPGFHLRNAKSNIWALLMKDGFQGFKPGRSFESMVGTLEQLGEQKALDLIPMKSRVNRALNRKVGGKTVKEWAEFAKKRGIITHTQQGFDPTDISKRFKKKGVREGLNPGSLENYLFSASKRVGGVIESQPKFASFLNDIERMARYGDLSDETAEWAVLNTKKWFFDYSDLTEFEQKYLKKVIPFYTWIRKNIALQLSTIAEKGNDLKAFAKFQNLQWDDETDREAIPEWAREAGYIPTGKEENMTRFIDPGLPYLDLNKLPLNFTEENGYIIPKLDGNALVDEFLGMSDPLVKTVAAVGFGKDIFRKRDLSSHSDTPRIMRFLNKTPKVVGVIDGALKMAGFEDGMNLRVGKDGKLEMDAKIAAILENHFLPVTRLGQVLAIPSSFNDKIEQAVEAATGTKDKYEAAERFFQTFSFLFGIKQKDMDLDQEERWRFEAALKRAEAKRREWRKKQPGYEKSVDKYRKRREAKIKRMRAAQ